MNNSLIVAVLFGFAALVAGHCQGGSRSAKQMEEPQQIQNQFGSEINQGSMAPSRIVRSVSMSELAPSMSNINEMESKYGGRIEREASMSDYEVQLEPTRVARAIRMTSLVPSMSNMVETGTGNGNGNRKVREAFMSEEYLVPSSLAMFGELEPRGQLAPTRVARWIQVASEAPSAFAESELVGNRNARSMSEYPESVAPSRVVREIQMTSVAPSATEWGQLERVARGTNQYEEKTPCLTQSAEEQTKNRIARGAADRSSMERQVQEGQGSNRFARATENLVVPSSAPLAGGVQMGEAEPSTSPFEMFQNRVVREAFEQAEPSDAAMTMPEPQNNEGNRVARSDQYQTPEGAEIRMEDDQNQQQLWQNNKRTSRAANRVQPAPSDILPIGGTNRLARGIQEQFRFQSADAQENGGNRATRGARMGEAEPSTSPLEGFQNEAGYRNARDTENQEEFRGENWQNREARGAPNGVRHRHTTTTAAPAPAPFGGSRFNRAVQQEEQILGGQGEMTGCKHKHNKVTQQP